MTELLVAGVGVAGLFLWVVRPLLREIPGSGQAAPDPAGDSRWNELVEAKHSVLRSILDLEHDRAVGKVSPEDFGVLRRRHESEAVAIIREMDRLASAPRGDPDDVLEAEIAVARERLRDS